MEMGVTVDQVFAQKAEEFAHAVVAAVKDFPGSRNQRFGNAYPEIRPTVSGEFILEKLPTLSGESAAGDVQANPHDAAEGKGAG